IRPWRLAIASKNLRTFSEVSVTDVRALSCLGTAEAHAQTCFTRRPRFTGTEADVGDHPGHRSGPERPAHNKQILGAGRNRNTDFEISLVFVIAIVPTPLRVACNETLRKVKCPTEMPDANWLAAAPRARAAWSSIGRGRGSRGRARDLPANRSVRRPGLTRPN